MTDNDLATVATGTSTQLGTHGEQILPPALPPPASRGGAPLGNENRQESGCSAWVKSGTIPRCYRALREDLKKMPIGLSAEVQRVKGRRPNLYELCVIGTVVRHAGRIALLERWLAREHATMPLGDRLAVLKEIGAASTSLTKAMQALGIDRDATEADDFDARLRSGALDVPAEPYTDNATAGRVGDEEGGFREAG